MHIGSVRPWLAQWYSTRLPIDCSKFPNFTLLPPGIHLNVLLDSCFILCQMCISPNCCDGSHIYDNSHWVVRKVVLKSLIYSSQGLTLLKRFFVSLWISSNIVESLFFKYVSFLILFFQKTFCTSLNFIENCEIFVS